MPQVLIHELTARLEQAGAERKTTLPTPSQSHTDDCGCQRSSCVTIQKCIIVKYSVKLGVCRDVSQVFHPVSFSLFCLCVINVLMLAQPSSPECQYQSCQVNDIIVIQWLVVPSEEAVQTGSSGGKSFSSEPLHLSRWRAHICTERPHMSEANVGRYVMLTVSIVQMLDPYCLRE